MTVDSLQLVRARMTDQRYALQLAISGASYSRVGALVGCGASTAHRLVGAALALTAVADHRLAMVVGQERVPLALLSSQAQRLSAVRRDPALAQAVLATHDRVALLHRFLAISVLADVVDASLTAQQRGELGTSTDALIRELTAAANVDDLADEIDRAASDDVIALASCLEAAAQ